MAKSLAARTSKPKTAGNAKPAGYVDGRTAVRHRNREAILAAADKLFREYGYEAVSTREVIAAAGVGLGTFYNHFKDKEDLFRIMLEERNAALIPRQRRYRLEAQSFPEMIRRHYEMFFQSICDDPANFELFHRNAAAIRETVSGPAEVQGFAALQEDIENAIAAGKVASMDAEFAATAIMAIAVELGIVVVRRNPPDPEGAARFAAQLLISGLPWRLQKARAGTRVARKKAAQRRR